MKDTPKKRAELEHTVGIAASVVGLAGAAIFATPTITGNAVGNIDKGMGGALAVILLAVAALGITSLVRRQRRKKAMK